MVFLGGIKAACDCAAPSFLVIAQFKKGMLPKMEMELGDVIFLCAIILLIRAVQIAAYLKQRPKTDKERFSTSYIPNVAAHPAVDLIVFPHIDALHRLINGQRRTRSQICVAEKKIRDRVWRSQPEFRKRRCSQSGAPQTRRTRGEAARAAGGLVPFRPMSGMQRRFWPSWYPC